MNAVDVGFLQDMLDHHDQALLISNIYLDDQPQGDAAPYAREVIMFQTRDIGWMEDWLAEEGYARGIPDRMAMEWMGEPTPVAEMPGMQTTERLQELADATGAEQDRLWFEIMTDHHFGGVHMGDHAAANGAHEEITAFAESVSRTSASRSSSTSGRWNASASSDRSREQMAALSDDLFTRSQATAPTVSR